MVTDLPIVPATAADDDTPAGPTRRETRRITVGPVPVGGGAPISVQTMTVTPTHQVDETLQADDVLTVIHQPYSFIALGAVAQNAEVPFEGSGLSLAQALGRIGGFAHRG